MPLTATTLGAACAAGDLTLSLTSTTGFAPNQLVKIDNEQCYVVAVPSTVSLVVRNRGSNGTAAVAHDILANVVTSSDPLDFPALVEVNGTGLGQSQTLTLPTQNTTYLIDKATAAALVLPTPSKGSDGLTLRFTSQTAAAHTITAVALLADGVSGSPHGTATFAAYKGASLTLCVDAGLYNVVAAVGVTVA